MCPFCQTCSGSAMVRCLVRRSRLRKQAVHHQVVQWIHHPWWQKQSWQTIRKKYSDFPVCSEKIPIYGEFTSLCSLQYSTHCSELPHTWWENVLVFLFLNFVFVYLCKDKDKLFTRTSALGWWSWHGRCGQVLCRRRRWWTGGFEQFRKVAQQSWLG